jgi:N-acetylglutamate synthase-like GNAT family acetyltransferase
LVSAASYEIGEATAEEVRPLRSRYLRPDHPDEAVVYKSDIDETARHFAARDAEGRILAVASLCVMDRVAGIPPFGHPGMRMRGLAVEDDSRGKGIGAAMVAHLLEIAREAGVAEAWATAPTRNLPFFRKHKFRPMSSEFEVAGFGMHRVVARNL